MVWIALPNLTQQIFPLLSPVYSMKLSGLFVPLLEDPWLPILVLIVISSQLRPLPFGDVSWESAGSDPIVI